VEGVVYVTGPVAGATVFAYALELTTGEPGTLLAESSPTAVDGRFTLDLAHKNHGPVLFVAKGAGVASYAEPSTGGTVVFDSVARLRGTYVARDASQDLRFDVPSKDTTLVVLSPWSELAMEYATARHRHQLSPTFASALATSFALLRDHLEYDFWDTEPEFLAHDIALEPVPSFLGIIELVGLSEIARRIAVDSRTGDTPVSSLALLAALVRDIADPRAQFDGEDFRGALRVGTCESVCPLSGKTLRGHLAEGIATALQTPSFPSGVTLSEMRATLRRLASRQSELFAEPGTPDFDTSPPHIELQGVRIAQVLSGDHSATVTVTDNIEMGTVRITLVRNDIESSASEFFSTTLLETSTDNQHIVSLRIHSDALPDGPMTIRVMATDAAGNAAPSLELSVFTDNQPSTTLSGVVWAGGPVAAATVEVWEYNDATKGVLLGTSTSAIDGTYAVVLADSSATVLLVEAQGTGGDSSYEDLATGATLPFSARDRLSTVLTELRPSTTRPDAMLTPYTTLAVAYAHRVHTYLGMYWPDAISRSFAALEAHFDPTGLAFRFRETAPTDLSRSDAGAATPEVVYGLALAGVSELARTFTAQFGTPLSPLAILDLLTQDIGQGDGAPVLDGRGTTPLFLAVGHPLTSYLTRVDLANAIAAFVTQNPRDRSSLRLADIASLLERISTDDGGRGTSWPRLYPGEDRPLPYDTEPPAPITFLSPTPADGTVLRGRLTVSAESMDNRALASLAWTEPTFVENVVLDHGAGKDGVWILTGALDTDVAAEGTLRLVARAQDEAGLTTDGERTFVVDRTPPNIRIDNASQKDPTTLATLSLADGGWTRLDALSAFGAVTDLHIDSARASWNGGTPQPLALGDQGGWSLPDLGLNEGANTLTVDGLDHAGNNATNTAIYHRDSIAPVVSIDQALNGLVVVPPDTWTTAASLLVSGTVEELNLAEALYSFGPNDTALTNPTYPLPQPDKWTVTVPLEQGKNTLVVRVRDKAGHSALATTICHRDSIAPVVTVDKAAAGGVALFPNDWTGGAPISIAGRVLDTNLATATYRWNGDSEVSLPLSGTGRWTLLDLPLNAGANTLVVVATDVAGTTTRVEVTYFRDAAPPIVQIVPTSLEDEAAWSVVISPDQPGTVTYKKPSITTIVILDTASAKFTKFATTYGPRSANLPEAHFSVSDNQTPSDAIVFEVGLLRRNFLTNTWDTLLPESSLVGHVNGTDHNRSVVLSSAYHPDLALQSGLYRLVVRARDAYGNVSPPETLTWQQSLRTPPLRQRQAGPCPSTSPQCPSYYGLASYQNNTADLIYGGGELEPWGNKVAVAEGYIDNPNDIPVRVNLGAISTRSWTWATRYYPYVAQTYTRDEGVREYPDWSCGFKDVTPDGKCYTFTPRNDSFFGSGNFVGLAPSVSISGTTLASCSGCQSTEYEIPPKTTARVRYLAHPYTPIEVAFLSQTLDPARDYATPALTAVDSGFDWLRCLKTEGGGFAGGATFCTRWVRYREYLTLTTASLTPDIRVSLQARPASPAATLGQAEGVGVKDFVYTAAPWTTTEDTAPLF
jgi:hypothetical protein